mmetsp:Transcript_27118/g.62337  ORF Transcript_27118/g.62337 Transcript_27118/m.62337 type:complete len:204 (+) Transcript_27118:739-1350(+)
MLHVKPSTVAPTEVAAEVIISSAEIRQSASEGASHPSTSPSRTCSVGYSSDSWMSSDSSIVSIALSISSASRSFAINFSYSKVDIPCPILGSNGELSLKPPVRSFLPTPSPPLLPSPFSSFPSTAVSTDASPKVYVSPSTSSSSSSSSISSISSGVSEKSGSNISFSLSSYSSPGPIVEYNTVRGGERMTLQLILWYGIASVF